MPVKKGQSKPEYSEDQRAAIVEQVCSLYESQHATIESCCNAAGIGYSTFALWCVQNADFRERYKKAKVVQDENYWHEVIRPLAKTALQKHLEVEHADKEVDVVYQGVMAKDADGSPIKQHTREFVLPNPTITIFAMKGLYPGMFADRHEHTGKDGGPIETKTLIIEIPADGGE